MRMLPVDVIRRAALLFHLCYVSFVAACFGGMEQLQELHNALGGQLAPDVFSMPIIKWSPGPPIREACELHCLHFDGIFTPACRWRNEYNVCEGETRGDQLDWTRFSGSWNADKGTTLFGTPRTPLDFYILVGSQEKMAPDHSAMLVSDPVYCQQGDGQLSFLYWTSPMVKMRVCTRRIGAGKHFDWCSGDVSTGDPGPANFLIPGSILDPFELVIEARNFVLDAFGHRGGIAIIDEISYNASRVMNCENIPHTEPPVTVSPEQCQRLTCSFEEDCEDVLTDSGWHVSDKPVGNPDGGVQTMLEGSFAFAHGPGDYALTFLDVAVPNDAAFELCYYRSARAVDLRVTVEDDRQDKSQDLWTSQSSVQIFNKWLCDAVRLPSGNYSQLAISTTLPSSTSYVAIDQLGLLDATRGTVLCRPSRSSSSRNGTLPANSEDDDNTIFSIDGLLVA